MPRSGKSAFNTNSNSPAYVGYMYGDSSYIYTRNDNPPAGTIYANDVSWDGTKYTLIDTYTIPAEGWLSTRSGATKPVYQEIAEKYHYTCDNTTATCTEVRYTHYTNRSISHNNSYLTLKNGKNIEQAKVEMYQNTNSSTIKTFIDEWYNGSSTNGLHAHEKLKDYADKLEDTTYCSDRTFATGPMKSKDDGLNAYQPIKSYSYHSAYGRNSKNQTINNNTVKPSLSCINQNDKLTEAKLGNKLGLLTADEAALAGNGYHGYSRNSYLNIGVDTWLFSPWYCGDAYASAFDVRSVGQMNNYFVNWSAPKVRASISLSSSSLVVVGDGTIEKPWVAQ